MSFLEVMERFKGTDAGKVEFKVQRDMEVLGKLAICQAAGATFRMRLFSVSPI